MSSSTAVAPTRLSAFKAYDVRGRMPDELNANMVYCVGRAYARVIKPVGPVAIGYDIRLTSAEFAGALAAGLNAEGIATRDIGMGGTEMVYYAAGQEGMGGGIMVTASHNPKDYNGLKMVKAASRPISGDDGLKEIEAETLILLADPAAIPAQFKTDPALHTRWDIGAGYVAKTLSFIAADALQTLLAKSVVKPLKVVVNAGNGSAGPTFDAIAEALSQYMPLEIIRVFHEPDGNFPNGVPNPMLDACQRVTADAVRSHQADLGIAWDGDFDRCFFFDEKGTFIEGYYLVGLFAEQILRKQPPADQARVIYDTRLIWNTQDAAERAGGQAEVSKCGHSFIKAALRETGAIYGGEMSAHHYFRDFFCCDSGMIPWLLVLERLAQERAVQADTTLSSLVSAAVAKFPCSGEINFTVSNAKQAIAAVETAARAEIASGRETLVSESDLDGLSLEFPQWRFNLRMSNTEPVVRLNVEARADAGLMQAKTAWLQGLLTA